jgi:nicotinamide phosphoribosyltransferase
LKELGFASTNVVLGIGSYTYEYVTRDTYGFAMKATYGEVNDEPRNIYKDPITDSGEKKSAKGLLRVVNGELKQESTWEELRYNNELEMVFWDGKLLKDENIKQIRERLNNA